MDEAVEKIIDLLNQENYSELSKLLNKYKGSYACLYLLKAMEDDRCDCPRSDINKWYRWVCRFASKICPMLIFTTTSHNQTEVIQKLDDLLIDRRPRVY